MSQRSVIKGGTAGRTTTITTAGLGGSIRTKHAVPFNCVDKALLALDSRNERMVFHIMLSVRGAVDSARLNHAVVSAVRRHPTMRSVLRNKWFRYHREMEEDPHGQMVTIRTLDGPETQRGMGQTGADVTPEQHLLWWLNEPLDPGESLPLRVLLLQKESRDYLVVFTFHHHSADGIRCLDVIAEVIDNYNSDADENRSLPEDRCSLHKRNELLNPASGSRAPPKHLGWQVVRALFDRFVIAPMSPPARIFHDTRGPLSPEIWFLSEKVDPLELERIESRAKASGATLNDLLLAACFKTVEKWNAQHGKPCKKISIMVPVDIGRHGPGHIVSNQVSYISPDTAPEDRVDPGVLLAKVSNARASLLKDGSVPSMVYFTYFLSFLPLPLLRAVGRLLLLSRVHVDSVLVTNLGRLWPTLACRGVGRTRVGDAIVYDVTIATPVITPFRMAIAAAIHSESLNISLSYRPCLVSSGSAQAFLSLYLQEIRRYETGQERHDRALTPGQDTPEVAEARYR